jgi:hypothetical protein
MAAVNPGCAGERTLLLDRRHPLRLRESYNDVATVALLADGWEDVTGVAEYEDHRTRIRNEGAALR